MDNSQSEPVARSPLRSKEAAWSNETEKQMETDTMTEKVEEKRRNRNSHRDGSVAKRNDGIAVAA